jgi:hypothetical protein
MRDQRWPGTIFTRCTLAYTRILHALAVFLISRQMPKQGGHRPAYCCWGLRLVLSKNGRWAGCYSGHACEQSSRVCWRQRRLLMIWTASWGWPNEEYIYATSFRAKPLFKNSQMLQCGSNLKKKWGKKRSSLQSNSRYCYLYLKNRWKYVGDSGSKWSSKGLPTIKGLWLAFYGKLGCNQKLFFQSAPHINMTLFERTIRREGMWSRNMNIALTCQSMRSDVDYTYWHLENSNPSFINSYFFNKKNIALYDFFHAQINPSMSQVIHRSIEELRITVLTFCVINIA